MPAGGSQRAAQDGVVQRLVMLLAFLGQEKRRVPVSRLRRLSDDYAGASGAQTLHRDLDELRLRGIVTVTSSAAPLARLTPLDKHPDWYLTRDEHVALAQARAELDEPPPSVAPLGPGNQERLDLLLRVLRFVEESPHAPTLRRLSRVFAVAPEHLRELLVLVAEDRATGTGLPGLTLRYPGTGHDGATGAQVADMVVRVSRPDIRRPGAYPMRDRGLHLIGAFPYSAAEADDRLHLIDKASALAAGGQREALLSARDKLLAWREHLRAVSVSM